MPMLNEEALVQRLSDLVGAEHVVAGEAALPYSVDMTAPMAVAFPASVEEVSAIMAFATSERLKIVPWGSGTKMGFGRVPEQLHVVLALSRLNRMVDHEPALVNPGKIFPTAKTSAGVGAVGQRDVIEKVLGRA